MIQFAAYSIQTSIQHNMIDEFIWRFGWNLLIWILSLEKYLSKSFNNWDTEIEIEITVRKTFQRENKCNYNQSNIEENSKGDKNYYTISIQTKSSDPQETH